MCQLEAATAVAGLSAEKEKAPGLKDRKELAAIQEVLLHVCLIANLGFSSVMCQSHHVINCCKQRISSCSSIVRTSHACTPSGIADRTAFSYGTISCWHRLTHVCMMHQNAEEVLGNSSLHGLPHASMAWHGSQFTSQMQSDFTQPKSMIAQIIF